MAFDGIHSKLEGGIRKTMTRTDGVYRIVDPILVFRRGFAHYLVEGPFRVTNEISARRMTGPHCVNVRIEEPNLMAKLNSGFGH
jgi:hypothetical protein